MLLPSKAYKEFEKKVCAWVKSNIQIEAISKPINMCCKFYKDKDYKSDLPGYLQAICDALVKAKVLEDDNHRIVSSTDGSEVLLDRNNPRIEVEIKEKEGTNV
jgi:Holliday junction resolvase RusA-like endonuclease